MNEGAFRDQSVLCGWCGELVDSDETHAVKGEKSFIHKTCWQKITYRAVEEHRAHKRKQIEEKNMKCEECGDWIGRMRAAMVSAIGWMSILLLTVGSISIPAFVLYKYWHASDVVTHCYIEEGYAVGNFKLYGSIEWRGDRELGNYDDIPSAIEAARLLQCPIKPVVEAGVE